MPNGNGVPFVMPIDFSFRSQKELVMGVGNYIYRSLSEAVGLAREKDGLAL